jgi:integrase
LADLSKKRYRDRLKVQRDPHYQTLGIGQSLGFRRGPDTWTARFRDRGGTQQYRALKGIDSNDYDGARSAAMLWFEQLGATPVRSVKRDTVRVGLESYLADLARHGRADAAKEALGRFKLTVYKDRIAGLALEAATKDDFLEFRDRLRKGRKPRTVNRHYRSIAAALNRALELGHIGNSGAWILRPLADDVEDDGETAIFLSQGQRSAIIAAAGAQASSFFRGLELTGARPKELAAAIARDFDGNALRLAHRKGKPPKLRVRYAVLSPAGIEFFSRATSSSLPGAPIFSEDGSQPWRRHTWAREFRSAAAKVNEKARGAARIPPGAGVYSFRHARISELLQIHGVDPLTVAHQTGTSLAMIEKAYMRFIPQALKDKLAALKDAGA